MKRPGALIAVAAILALVLAGCARTTYAPVADRSFRYGSDSSGIYEVQKGDTLYSIAWHHGLDHRDLARWNGISPPYIIYPGDELRLTPPPANARKHASVASRRDPQPAKRPIAAHSKPPVQAQHAAEPYKWQWPAHGKLVRTFSKSFQGKQGIDIAGSPGQPIHAAAGGRVVYSGDGLVGYGNLLIIKHDSHYLTAYAYNRKLLVKEGDRVRAGQVIARMGAGTDSNAELHFELRRDGKPVDPLRYLPPR